MKHEDGHTHPNPLRRERSLSLSHTHTCTHTPYPHTHVYTQNTHTHPPTHTHTHPHTHTHTHTQTHRWTEREARDRGKNSKRRRPGTQAIGTFVSFRKFSFTNVKTQENECTFHSRITKASAHNVECWRFAQDVLRHCLHQRSGY